MTDKVSFVETIEKIHGRIETRRYWITEEVDWLSGIENWSGLTSIGVVESERHEISTGITSIDRRLYMHQLKKTRNYFPQRFANIGGLKIVCIDASTSPLEKTIAAYDKVLGHKIWL